MLKSVGLVPSRLLKHGLRMYARPAPRSQSRPSLRGPQKKPDSVKKSPIVNPGIDHTLQNLKDEGVILSESEADIDMFENSEADFFTVGQLHRHHESETAKKKEDLKKYIVKEKYFDDNTPNFLTWSEKEQIRHLHNKDPEEWSVKRICESFPINESAARKVLKVVWKPASQNRIARHDTSAMRNWRELKEGTIPGVTPEMRKQFLKFTNRVIPPRSEEATRETQELSVQEKQSGEYASLLQSHRDEVEKVYKEKILSKIETPKLLESASNFIMPVVASEKKSTKNVTLDSLRTNILNKIENNEDVNEIDKSLVAPKIYSSVNDSDLDKNTNSLTSLSADEKEKSVGVFDENSKKMNAVEEDFKNRIRIPKKAWVKGGTYKVNDCYYDDDGRFLYRVPGMIKNHASPVEMSKNKDNQP